VSGTSVGTLTLAAVFGPYSCRHDGSCISNRPMAYAAMAQSSRCREILSGTPRYASIHQRQAMEGKNCGEEGMHITRGFKPRPSVPERVCIAQLSHSICNSHRDKSPMISAKFLHFAD
jgi:hypothetical protein